MRGAKRACSEPQTVWGLTSQPSLIPWDRSLHLLADMAPERTAKKSAKPQKEAGSPSGDLALSSSAESKLPDKRITLAYPLWCCAGDSRYAIVAGGGGKGRTGIGNGLVRSSRCRAPWVP